ncbi:hypothetical protein VTO42DRAFT_74 [Malbranchea cinnamomea]
MNDVGAASLVLEGVPTSHRPHEEARQDSLPSVSPPAISSPPTQNGNERKSSGVPATNDDDASLKAESEAETIIQSGREELSPEKKRTFVRHSLHETDEQRDENGEKREAIAGDGWKTRKRRRLEDESRDAEESRSFKSKSPIRSSSGRSSPTPQLKQEKAEDSLSTSRDSSRRSSEGPSVSTRNDAKGISAVEEVTSSVEGEARPQRDEQQTSEPSNKNDSENKTNNDNNFYPPPISSDRSKSPAVRSHRRAASTSHNSSIRSSKKKRPPPPLLTDHRRHHSEDRDSISSSASGSPAPTLKSRKFTSGEYSASSPAKQMPKNRRDQNGRTRLARACAAQETEAAIALLKERPEDLDVPDNAGNTPLQIAALEGCTEIVKHLIDAGCAINTRNIDKDTPLIDAVENGHLEVVKLLLDAGANPRIGNARGDEPYDLVPSDSEDCEEIRRVLREAKARAIANTESSSRRGEDLVTSATSPRESTPAGSARSPPPHSRRKTLRSDPTRNDLLWTKPTFEALRDFSAKGDMAGVVTVLNVLQAADTESLIAAAKGGHHDVLGILLGLGNPDPNPEPIRNGNHKPGYDTPMLAAIGRGNLQVIELLLDQRGFDPTRLDYRGRKYYEISEERKGENWDQEYKLLKSAYDNYKPPSGQRKQDVRSPRRSRDKDRSTKSNLRKESTSPELTTRKRPRRDSAQSIQKEEQVYKERRRGEDYSTDKDNLKPQSGDYNRQSMGGSDQDSSHSLHRKPRVSEGRKQEDSSSPTRKDEPVRRRRLFAGRPPPDHAARRASLLSSDSISSREEDSKSRMDSLAHESKPHREPFPPKRPRSSVSPGPEQPRERHLEDPQPKRRRVESEEDAFQSSRVESSGQSSDSQNRDPREEREVSRRPSSEEGLTNLKREEETTSATRPISDEVDALSPETKESMEAQEAEERHLATAARREQLEREAKEAKAAKEAEEAKEAADRAARAAREKAEEEERRRKEVESRRIRQAEEEQQMRLEHERLRQARLRREQEEQERRRREALPNRLRSAAELIGSNHPRARDHDWLRRFMPLAIVTTKKIDPSCAPESAEERWVPNYQVAPLLATNDLQLSQYPSWEKRQATPTQRTCLWRTTRNILTENDALNPLSATVEEFGARTTANRTKFEAMEHVFWVKLADFMELVPHIPHLQGLNLRLMNIAIDPEPLENHRSTQPHPPRYDGAFSELTNGDNAPYFGAVNGTVSHVQPRALE